jgi:peptidoglycan/LPS O-acetylase OafA/YrhL
MSALLAPVSGQAVPAHTVGEAAVTPSARAGDGGADGHGTTAPAKGTRQRLEHVDAMRPVKQAGVVSTHTLLAFAPAAALATGASLMLLHVTREAFLFVSSCMLAYSYRGLAKMDLRSYFGRRFVSVGVPYLCWTVIYFAITAPVQPGPVSTLPGHFLYLTATGYYQLYYLLVVMQFYVAFPLLMRLLRQTEGHHGRLLGVSAALQVLLVSLMHWNLVPAVLQGFWATREITSYQFYLIAGMVVARHLDEFHRWLVDHARLVVLGTVASAALAEAWYWAAARHLASWLGSSSDPFQPIVIPFNIGAIACIYLLGVALVDRRRGPRVRAAVRSGSDNAYGVYLAQMVFINVLVWLGWRELTPTVPWPLLCALTVAVVFGACVALTEVIARTPLAKPLTGRSRAPWPTRRRVPDHLATSVPSTS